MPLLGGRLFDVAYTNPLLPVLKVSFTPIKKGDWQCLCSSTYANGSGAASILRSTGKPKRGSEAPEREEGCGREFAPSHGREIFLLL